MNQLIQQPGLKEQKKQKFLLVLPVLVFPFLTFMLWSLGIFNSSQAMAGNGIAVKGLNMQLPGAKVKEERGFNKLSFYEQADRDSLKYRQELKNDPNYKGILSSHSENIKSTHLTGPDYDPSPGSISNYPDPNVEKIHQKLAELNKVLDAPAPDHAPSSVAVKLSEKNNPASVNGLVNSSEVDRLENMLHAISQNDTGADPEMQQLNAVMDKIMDIQHPERLSEKLKEPSVTSKQEILTVSLKDSMVANGFYSLEDDTINDAGKENAIEAIIPERQLLVSGAKVKLALVNDIYISGNRIAAGSFVYGIALLNNERLKISISSLRYQDNLLPVSLEAYDLDGLQGIYIPGSLNREVAKESSNQAISSIGLTSLDPSVAAQATGAGIQAAKTLLSKKVKLVKVSLEAGYRVLLKNNNAASAKTGI